MTEEEEKKSYRLETYLIAAFGLVVSSLPAEEVKALNRQDSFKRAFEIEFGRSVTDSALRATLDLMTELNLIALDEDEFAGTYITVQKTAFTAQLKNLAQQINDSPIGIASRAGRPWIDDVFSKESFWQKLDEDDVDDEPSDSDGRVSERDIPASDRTVTLLHNSPERLEIECNLNSVSDALRTSNEIAETLGDDRERISAEVEGVKAVLRSERIRLGYVRDTILRVLRELGGKLKDKAVEVGVDKLILLFEHILENYL